MTTTATTMTTTCTAPVISSSLPEMKDFTKLSDARHVLGKFHFEAILSEGYYGTIYLCCDNENGNKLSVAKVSDEASCTQTFYAELSMLRRLQHANVVTVIDAFAWRQELYMTLEYMNGGDLVALYACEAPWEEEYVSYAVRETLLALKHLHENNVIHRDIKLSNILWDREGRIKLADFGFAIALSKDQPTCCQVLGTPGYRAPEMLDRRNYTMTVDIWSLGVCTMELAQARAQTWDTFRGYALPTSTNYPRFFVDQASTMTPEFQNFARQMLNKQPKLRATAEQLLAHAFIKAHGEISKQEFAAYAAGRA